MLGYRGEVEFRYKIVGHNHLPKLGAEQCYSVGERIGQIMIVPYPTIEFEEITELSITDRGEGGFGSTNVTSITSNVYPNTISEQ